MTCKKGRVNPDKTAQFRLFAESGGYCQNPECLRPLFIDLDSDTIYIAEVAHIIAASGCGPRADVKLSVRNRASFDNLILLCPACHTEIDKAESHYPEDKLRSWKKDHKTRLDSAFGIARCPDRATCRRLATRFLRENRTVFETYGPEVEPFNPESSLPRLWIMKLRDTILPNNRKLLSLCEANEALLTDSERDTVERFRQHIVDLEARHIWHENVCGSRYPVTMNSIFEEILQ